MNKKKHDVSRIIKTATGAVFAVAAAALLYANNHTSLKSAAISENISVSVISDSMADNKSDTPRSAEDNLPADNNSDALYGSALININTATFEELQALPGIGAAKAAAIIEYREEHGSFSDVSEITNVSGIGEKMFENIRDSITTGENAAISGASTSSAVEVPEVFPININTATAEELQALPGIGAAKAAAIIEYREEHGSFSDVSEITNVSGIGDKMFENIRDSITTGENAAISGASTSSAVEVPEVFPININTATFEELQALPGIGAAKAAEITNVSGIGEKTFEKFSGKITI